MKISAFYSDPHFGHSNIIKYCSRPFSDIEQMTIELVKRYNYLISEDDLVVWVGDCTLGPPSLVRDRLKNIIPYMNGKKILVRGNHDNSAAYYTDIGFQFVVDELNVHIADTPCKICHFPYVTTQTNEISNLFTSRRPKIEHQDQILIHGHTHSTIKSSNRSINVSVEAWDYYPAQISEIKSLIQSINNES